MMHRVAWIQNRLHQLVLPYLLTGLPALGLAASCIAAIEMIHHRGEEFAYLGVTLSSASAVSWSLVLVAAAASFFATRFSIPQLTAAWESANALPENDKEQS